ncbi:MAG: hypothetical protein CV088_16050 [Nitrospira sp. LK70]|nr:hypothetical protein [Nitrospira sp. LK70]
MSWTGQNWGPNQPRFVTDLTGDGCADIVGFGNEGVWVALNKGNGTFQNPKLVLKDFGYDQGWRADRHPRFVMDLTGDGKADLIGFGDDWVWVAFNNGDGTFSAPKNVTDLGSYNTGWRVDQHPRFVVDLTGDGKADLIGFGGEYIWVALNNGDGTFQAPKPVLDDLVYSKGWHVDQHPRFVADLTGDGRADLIGFGDDWVWVAFNNGDGTFSSPKNVTDLGTYNTGWRVDQHPRFVVDLTGDGKADLIGFGGEYVWVALNKGDGTFQAPTAVLNDLVYNTGWRVDQHPRFVVDLTGDGKADLVGFGQKGVWTAISKGNGTFGEAKIGLEVSFGFEQGWRVDQHLRLLADLNGDGKTDIIGFGTDAGPWGTLSNGDGTFAEPKFIPDEIQHRIIDLDFLERILDTFFNNRERPLFQLKVSSSTNPPTFGESTLSVAMDSGSGLDPARQYDFDKPLASIPLADKGSSLDFTIELGPIPVATYKYYFQDVKSDKLTAELVRGEPLAILLTIHFETEGPIEIKVEGHTGQDIDFDGFHIVLRPEITQRGNSLDLFGFVDEIESALMSGIIGQPIGNRPGGEYTFTVQFRGETIVQRGPVLKSLPGIIRDILLKRFIKADVSVNVGGWWPDGYVANTVEGTINSKIYDQLKAGKNSTADSTDNAQRDSLNAKVRRWLVGGDFPITGLSSDNSTLTIDYLVPPGRVPLFPENPQPSLDPGRLANIDHIVVLMMENRSFDHMLGYLSLDAAHNGRARADIEGLRVPPNAYANSYREKHYSSFRIATPDFITLSPPHEHAEVDRQIGGNMEGFVSEYAAKYKLDGEEASHIMGYYDAANVPVYDELAKKFLVCDRWFAAHPGPTFCNRFYYLTGRLNRDDFERFQVDNFSGADFKPVTTRTIFDHLYEHGVSWRFYQQRYCTLRLFAKYTFDHQNIVDFDDAVNGFEACAAAGTLPSVTFIDPNFVDEPDAGDNDDAAPGNISRGQALVGRIVNALMKGPKWGKTLFVVTYDEHGGFYDHVNPKDPSYRDTAVPVCGIDYYGVRVPTLIVSPWVAAGSVSHDVFDHTSIIKTIARRFMSASPPDMGERVAKANDLSKVLQATPQQNIEPIVVPPLPAPRHTVRQLEQQPPSPDSAEFKDVMRFLMSRSSRDQ